MVFVYILSQDTKHLAQWPLFLCCSTHTSEREWEFWADCRILLSERTCVNEPASWFTMKNTNYSSVSCAYPQLAGAVYEWDVILFVHTHCLQTLWSASPLTAGRLHFEGIPAGSKASGQSSSLGQSRHSISSTPPPAAPLTLG